MPKVFFLLTFLQNEIIKPWQPLVHSSERVDETKTDQLCIKEKKGENGLKIGKERGQEGKGCSNSYT